MPGIVRRGRYSCSVNDVTWRGACTERCAIRISIRCRVAVVFSSKKSTARITPRRVAGSLVREMKITLLRQ